MTAPGGGGRAPREVSATRVRGERPRWATVSAGVALPAVLATLAVVHPGAPVSQVDLHDGAVWLTNTSELKLGRYNPRVDELNAGLVATTSEFDVLQDAEDVLLTERGRVSVVDPASVTLAAQVSVPGGATVDLGAGTVAVADTDEGAVWVRSTEQLGSLSVDSDAPDLDLGPGGVATVTRSGVVLAVDADGEVHRAEVDDAGQVHTEHERTYPDVAGPGDQVTAVGEDLVVLVGTRLHTPGGAVELAGLGADLVLQRPGPEASTVLVAGRSALVEVPLDGGDAVEHATGGTGTPAAPVRVAGCGHGAWASGVGSYLQLCDGSAPRVVDLEGMTTADELVFRVNRDVVVLNDTQRGRLWIPTEDPELRRPNWQDIEPQEDTEADEDAAESRESVQNLVAECSSESAVPTAADDEFGVRPGRTTILPVIDNDGSSECGILTISEHDPLPEDFGTLEPVHGGRALQLRTLPGASGTAEFTYTITDGRGTSAPSTATVRLTLRPDGVNAAPEQTRPVTMLVEQGAQARQDILPDFRDPDGDDLILVSAEAESGGTVRTRQDGELTFSSDGGSLGRHRVTVVVSDGMESVRGEVDVEVRPAGSLAPIIDPVHAVTYVDAPVVVRPMDSVRSVSREPARLAGVDELAGATIEPDLSGGTFTFTAARPGTYYVTFLVTAAPQQVTGLARIDVREQPDVSPPPVAVRDRALLPPGGEVTIDPLANDHDPAGGVLVLQSVDVPDGTGLQVAVLGHQLLRISSLRVLDEPVTLTYTMSNGTDSAVGEVLVQPIPASAGQQPPVVPDAEASVRTGGVVTVRVLEDAYDPDGDPLSLVPELAEPLGSGEGLLFVSGDVLRYQAPDTPMDVHATFTVTDPSGNRTSAQLTVSVHESDAEAKAPPRPRSLVARVFEGETIRIDVPLVGIDPDGDGVTLLGEDRAPLKGRITAVGADWLEYEALPGELGTDTFTYAVEDWVGQRAVGTVRVGIAPRPTASAQVVARDDDVTVRPGHPVEVRVTANDVDTSGGELTLDPELDTAEDVEARVEGRRIVVQVPDEPTVLQVGYTVTNDRGGRGSAVLTVTVSEDAPILPPVARDVVVPATDTINRTRVEVDVLDVAQNPSGPLSDLAVSVDPSVRDVATVNAQGEVVVTLVDSPQTLPYVLTNTAPDAGGVRSYAFITVPALGDFPPVLRPGAPPLRVVAGERLTIDLDEQVQVAPGRSARIVDASSVRATKSDGSALVGGPRTLHFTAERGYAGPASISFEVSDGPGGDETARTRSITLPITVLAAEDHPPTFSPSVVDVPPGEEPVQVDLQVFTSAPVGTAEGVRDYRYRLSSEAPEGLDVSLDGSVLSVSADPTVPRGTVGGVAVEIGYGVSGTISAQVDFRVVASSRRLARVVDHRVPDGVEGRVSTVEVLAGAYNPFPGEPLSVVSATVETPGSGTVSVAGSAVSVRPDEGFIGTMVTRYRVRDVTGSPDREVEGRITVVVRGRPDTPTAPRVTEVRDRTAVLAWDAPTNNGEPITGYRVTIQPGGATRECASTTCTIDDLTNDVEHTFTVEARNAVGWSDRSPASQPARPDTVPGRPGAPELSFHDAALTARWSAPETSGSPITSYTVEVSPASANGASFTTTSTDLRIGGLTNGRSYAVRVRAHNRAPDPGPWSGWTEMVPARTPDAPSVTATRVEDELGGKIDVRWTPGSAGGDAIIDYELVIADGPGARTVSGLTGTSYQFTDAANGVPYTFAVRARNKAGHGSAGTATASAFGLPGRVPALRAEGSTARDSAAAGAGYVDLSWDAADGNGTSVAQYEVRRDGGNARTVTGRQTRWESLVGGQSYTFDVRACHVAGCGEWASVSETPVTVPGAPGSPDVQAVFDDGWPVRVEATWSEASQSGGAGTVTYEYRVLRNGAEELSWKDASGRQASFPLDRAWFSGGSTSTIQVEARARSSAGPSEPSGRGSIEVAAKPPGAVRDAALAPAADGVAVRATWQAPASNGGPPVTGYQVRFRVNDGSWGAWSAPTAADTRFLERDVGSGEIGAEIRALNGVDPGGPATFVETTVPAPGDGP